MTVEASPSLARGQAALADGRWAEAAEAFGGALELGEDPDATFGLAIARWWLGDNAQAMRGWERAYALYRRQGQAAGAVMAAFYVCLAYQMTFGNGAAARGWLGRAARVAAGPGGEGMDGWIALARAHFAFDDGRPGEAERWALQAGAVAAASADVDLELCAASELGAALVEQGRIEEGAALLDEAMAGAFAGEGRDRDAVVLISCRSITAASRGGDLRRVIQWVTAADAFYQRYGSPHLHATCRAQYGAILFATGSWSDAERELTAALRLAQDADASVRAEALATLAELRLAQGRGDEAERLVTGYEAHAPTTVPLALLDLARGRARAAAVVLRRGLRHRETGSIAAARLQALVVEAELAAGRIEAAAEIAATLTETAAATGVAVVEGRAAVAAGRVALARSDRPRAATSFDAAADAFQRANVPFDAAHARLLLAETLATSDPERAVAEGRAALAALDALGAARAADSAAALLRSLGVRSARSFVAATGLLTRRELEVLALLGEGLSNRQIADRLFITPKTAEHHVANVLAKTGLGSRTEAAAYAVRHLVAGASGAAPQK